MLRRVVSILAALSILASQLAVMPHAHAEMSAVEQHKHGTHRHFHVGRHLIGEQGRLGYQGRGHSHSGRSESSHQHKHYDERQPTPVNLPAGDHDSDAVYVPIGCASVIASGDDGSATATSIATVVDSTSPVLLCMKGGGTVPPFWEPAGAGSSACPRYLQLRTLRI